MWTVSTASGRCSTGGRSNRRGQNYVSADVRTVGADLCVCPHVGQPHRVAPTSDGQPHRVSPTSDGTGLPLRRMGNHTGLPLHRMEQGCPYVGWATCAVGSIKRQEYSIFIAPVKTIAMGLRS